MFRFILVFLLCSNSAFAQVPFGLTEPTIEIPQKQLTFMRAKSATLLESNGEILILAEELQPEPQYGVELQLDKSVTYVEVFDLLKPFPPKILKPLPTGQFIVTGKPQQRFYVRIPSDIPEYAEVVINPKGTKPIDPPITEPDLKALTDLSREKASKLDKETAVLIKKTIAEQITLIENKCNAGACPTKDEANKQIVDAINLIKKNKEYDWFVNWRVPISDAIRLTKPVGTQAYLNAMKAVAEGL